MTRNEMQQLIRQILEGPQSPVRHFPALLDWMMNVTLSVLDASIKPTVEEVKRMIAMEVGYLNTSHPDFLGHQGLGTWIAEERKNRIKMRKGGNAMRVPGQSGRDLVLGHKDGVLMKLGGARKNWKKRFFVLKNGSLLFYESGADKTAKGEFELAGCVVRDCTTKEVFPLNEDGTERKVGHSLENEDELAGKDFAFEIYSGADDAGVLFRNHKSLCLCAESDKEKDAWIQVLSESIAYLAKKEQAMQTRTGENEAPQDQMAPPVAPRSGNVKS